jgi:hypothetical protein
MPLKPLEVQAYIWHIAPKLGKDYTQLPLFPVTQNNVAAVTHEANNGSDFTYTVIYGVWENPDGTLGHVEILNTRSTRTYRFPRHIWMENNEILVDCGEEKPRSFRPPDRGWSS